MVVIFVLREFGLGCSGLGGGGVRLVFLAAKRYCIVSVLIIRFIKHDDMES